MSPACEPIVVALGGNAISPESEEGRIDQQFARTAESAGVLADLIASGMHLIVTHGNGPQVGQVLRRVELAAHECYRLPLDICVADTQGGMGFMIALSLNNALRRRNLPARFSALVTTVEVDRDDPAFARPSKPIGGYYDEARAAELRRTHGWVLTEGSGRRFRRVVPSPRPRHIAEIELIRRLAADGELLVVGGGGGVPVARDQHGELAGVEAVIDKDLTSALLAREIGARRFVIATSVGKVALDFGRKTQRTLDSMTAAEARLHLNAGQFPPGSMGPKIEAGLDFLEFARHRDAQVVICHLDEIDAALHGHAGTRIVRG